MTYEVWRKSVVYGGWESHVDWRYRWQWLARFVAWSRTKAGWTRYVAVPKGGSPYDVDR